MFLFSSLIQAYMVIISIYSFFFIIYFISIISSSHFINRVSYFLLSDYHFSLYHSSYYFFIILRLHASYLHFQFLRDHQIRPEHQTMVSWLASFFKIRFHYYFISLSFFQPHSSSGFIFHHYLPLQSLKHAPYIATMSCCQRLLIPRIRHHGILPPLSCRCRFTAHIATPRLRLHMPLRSSMPAIARHARAR